MVTPSATQFPTKMIGGVHQALTENGRFQIKAGGPTVESGSGFTADIGVVITNGKKVRLYEVIIGRVNDDSGDFTSLLADPGDDLILGLGYTSNKILPTAPEDFTAIDPVFDLKGDLNTLGTIVTKSFSDQLIIINGLSTLGTFILADDDLTGPLVGDDLVIIATVGYIQF